VCAPAACAERSRATAAVAVGPSSARARAKVNAALKRPGAAGRVANRPAVAIVVGALVSARSATA
jgi:hypothetical protein